MAFATVRIGISSSDCNLSERKLYRKQQCQRQWLLIRHSYKLCFGRSHLTATSSHYSIVDVCSLVCQRCESTAVPALIAAAAFPAAGHAQQHHGSRR